MNQRLTRRRFGKLAIAGTTAAGVSYLASKTFAQTTPSLDINGSLVVYGVSPGSPTSIDDTTTTEINSTDPTGTEYTTPASTDLGLLLPTLNVATGQLQTSLTPPENVNLKSDEQVTGFTSLTGGRLVLAITPVSTSRNEATRLVFVGGSPAKDPLTVSGLTQQEKLGSLVGTKDGKLLGLVVRKNGTPPVRLVDINVDTGAISSSNLINLPENERFSNLAQCQDGKLYTTVVGRQGETSLVLLDQAQQKRITLSFNGSIWNNGLQSLVCSAAGQLLALGALRYETPNYLHTVNPNTGAMTRLTLPLINFEKDFDVAKITIPLL